MLNDVLFFTAMACLLAHELDAIQQAEWRFFFARFGMSDTVSYQLFTALHVPLLVLIFGALSEPSFRVGFDIFLIVHLGLHLLLRHHPLIHFNNWFSQVWIWGGALLGIAHLILGRG